MGPTANGTHSCSMNNKLSSNENVTTLPPVLSLETQRLQWPRKHFLFPVTVKVEHYMKGYNTSSVSSLSLSLFPHKDKDTSKFLKAPQRFWWISGNMSLWALQLNDLTCWKWMECWNVFQIQILSCFVVLCPDQLGPRWFVPVLLAQICVFLHVVVSDPPLRSFESIYYIYK